MRERLRPQVVNMRHKIRTDTQTDRSQQAMPANSKVITRLKKSSCRKPRMDKKELKGSGNAILRFHEMVLTIW